MLVQNWVAHALTLTTHKARQTSLEQWSPSLLARETDKAPFDVLLETASPQFQSFITEMAERFRNPNYSLLPYPDLRPYFESLTVDERGELVRNSLLLDIALTDLGSSKYALDIKDGDRGWMCQISIWILLWSTESEFRMSVPQFIETLHAWHYCLRKWPIGALVYAGHHKPVVRDMVARLVACIAGAGNEIASLWMTPFIVLFDQLVVTLPVAKKPFVRLPSGKVSTYDLRLLADAQLCVIQAIQSGSENTIAQRSRAAWDEIDERRKRYFELGRRSPILPFWKKKPSNIGSKIRKAERDAILLFFASRPVAFDQTTGMSFFGGLPFMPDGADWPEHKIMHTATPMTFLCQVDCSDLPGIRNSGLPKRGLLLFFARTDNEQREINSKVIYVEPNDIPAHPTAPPSDLLGPHNQPFNMQLLQFESGEAAVHFKRPIFFAPYKSYPDSEGWPSFGWNHGTEFEKAVRRLQSQALVDAIRHSWTRAGRPPPSRTHLNAPKRDFDELALFWGGPHCWADVVYFLAGMTDALDKIQRFSEYGPPYIAPDPQALGDSAKTLQDDCRSFVSYWRTEAESLGTWSKVGNESKRLFREQLEELCRRASAAGKAAQTLNDATMEAWKSQPENAGKSCFIRYGLPTNAHELLPRSFAYLIADNLKLAAHLGKDADSLYPPAVVDKFCAANDVGPDLDTLEANGAEDASPFELGGFGGHQILGYGTTVQSAPLEFADKILLLQLFGGEAPWLPSTDCVYQFWISRADLKMGRFEKAFLTLECG